MIIDLIVNPASGPRVRGLARDARLAHAVRLLESWGAAEVRATETRGPGDGEAAARRAVADARELVVVWGGDGTVNAVARELIGTPVALSVVPGGSGNGLARALGIPLRADAALRVALEGRVRDVDTGLAGERAFFNMAGIGFDAAVAQRYNTAGTQRGLLPYAQACAQELWAHEAATYTIHLDGEPWFEGEAHLAAIANGQQYGHNARIAPDAELDDGWFDVVVVPDVTPWRVLCHGWRLFHRSVQRVAGVRTQRARQVEVRISEARLLHLDGEVHAPRTVESFTIRPRSLKVKTP
jgi:YegS/Rv2252/BmrU family lipid kinase